MIDVKYWCNSHRRPATIEYMHADGKMHKHCESGPGGQILLPCQVIDCDEIGIEILWEEEEVTDA